MGNFEKKKICKKQKYLKYLLQYSRICPVLHKQVSVKRKMLQKRLVFAVSEAVFTIQTRKVWFAFDCFNTVIYTILY